MIDDIGLQPEQQELLLALAEASRNVPRESRRAFTFAQTAGFSDIIHPGLPNQRRPVARIDIEALQNVGFVSIIQYQSPLSMSFYVTPPGFKYYVNLKQQMGQPIERTQAIVRDYLIADDFQRRFPAAYQKCSDAEALLWDSDSDRQLSTIGHLCRLAVQEFATALVEKHQPPNVEPDKTKTVKRLQAVLIQRSERLGSTEKPFLEALLAYWWALNELIQRQVHEGNREGEPLIWEDGRRVVFQTAVVMFEIDGSLSRGG